MKTNKIITALVLGVFALSCTPTQVDYFGQTASSRVQEALDNARKALFSSENGWKMEYFTGIGGYNYALQFIEYNENGVQVDSVVATSELAASVLEGSYFRLTNDNGPTLSFDTYNPVLHKFATPSSSEYQAYGGDFEFIILSATPDKIVLKGKRSGFISTLTPVSEEEGSYVDFAKKMSTFSQDFIVLNATGFINEIRAYLEFDLTNHLVTFYHYTEKGDIDDANPEGSAPYIITEEGLKFEHEITVYDFPISEMHLNKDKTRIYISEDFSGGDVDFTLTVGEIPSDYCGFTDFVGTYDFSYAGGSRPGTTTVEVELKIEDEMSRVYEMTGFTEDYHGFYLYYDASTGRLQYLPQYLGTSEPDDMGDLILGFTCDGSYLSTSAPIDIAVDGSKEQGFKFVPNAKNKFKATMILVYREFEDEDGETDYEPFSAWSPNQITPKKLVRK